jgi:RNA polymerase sigma-70 factor (ECF subfamily)
MHMDAEWLSEAISRARNGDPDGYSLLLDAYGQRLYGYFYRATRRHHDAEDLLGEMALRLVKRLADYDERGRFEPWLFRIASNLVRDRIRRKKRRPTPASLSAGGEDDSGSLGEVLADPDQAPVDGGMLLAEQTARLREALDRLDPTSREMVIMRHFGQMSFREIADTMGCPLGTALAKVHRALKSLRAMMESKK